MMKKYLQGLIKEQIDRGIYLKTLIPFPLPYAELSSLASLCSKTIDDNIAQLDFLLKELDRNENDLDYVYRGFRACQRNIELTEYYGISALCHHKSDEMEYLNKLIFKIPQEINLPLPSPSVACISNSYYYLSPFTNVIFVPIGESNFLLHLPDVFHEIGHEVLYHRENNLKLKGVEECYREAVSAITKYYQELLTMKVRETGPTKTLQTIMYIHSQWKNYWIDEIFSDLFACYTLGPAFAWAHLHLVTKKTDDAYVLTQKHPSDDSRMRILLIGLKKLGFNKEADEIRSQWEKMPFIANIEPVNEYQYAYPEKLMNDVADILLRGLRASNFLIVSPAMIAGLKPNSIVKLLNDAWKEFWINPLLFREWEQDCIKKLRFSIK
jgi:hypothetical protein